jgi:hypothetical protein
MVFCKKCLELNPGNRAARMLQALCFEYKYSADCYFDEAQWKELEILYPEYCEIYLMEERMDLFSDSESYCNQALTYDPNYA